MRDLEYEQWSDGLVEQATIAEMDEYYSSLHAELQYQEKVLVSFPQDRTWHNARRFIRQYAPAMRRSMQPELSRQRGLILRAIGRAA